MTADCLSARRSSLKPQASQPTAFTRDTELHRERISRRSRARTGDADLPASPRAARCARTPPRIPNGRRAAIPAHYLTELALTFAKSRLPKPVSSSHPDFAL